MRATKAGGGVSEEEGVGGGGGGREAPNRRFRTYHACGDQELTGTISHITQSLYSDAHALFLVIERRL